MNSNNCDKGVPPRNWKRLTQPSASKTLLSTHCKAGDVWLQLFMETERCASITLFALPRIYIFLCTLKLYVLGLQNAIDFRQPYILATSATFVSISCECPRFHASVMRTARLFAWKIGHTHENADKGCRGHRDFWLVEFDIILLTSKIQL